MGKPPKNTRYGYIHEYNKKHYSTANVEMIKAIDILLNVDDVTEFNIKKKYTANDLHISITWYCYCDDCKENKLEEKQNILNFILPVRGSKPMFDQGPIGGISIN